MNKQKGFTLIELLVVLSIISLLSSIVMASLNSAIDKANVAAGEEFDATTYHAIGANMVLQWYLNGSAADTSGFNNNGTINGGTTCSTTGGHNGTGACSFDGTSARIFNTTLSNNPVGNSSVTVSAWVYPTTENGGSTVFTYGNSSSLNDLQLFFDNNPVDIGNNPGFCFGSYGWSGTYTTCGKVPVSKWSLLASVYDAIKKTMSLYVNGTLVAQTSTASITLNLSGSYFYLGNYYGNGAPYYFQGYIDTVRMYASNLTAMAIEQLYAEGKASHPGLALK